MNPTNLIAASSIAAATAGVMHEVARPAARLSKRVRPYLLNTRFRLGQGADIPTVRMLINTDERSSAARVLGTIVDPVARALSGVLERRTDTELQEIFRKAGRPNQTPESYRSTQVLHSLGGAAIGALLALALGRASLAPLVALLGGIVGATRLRGAIERAVEYRAEAARMQIVTINQLLAIQLRTGASPITALQRVCDRATGVVVEEAREMLASIRNGMSEAEAFRNGAERSVSPGVSRTFALLATGTERGTDLAAALLAFSRDLQDAQAEATRRQATRKRAAMLMPTIGVLAPVMLLFLAAPLPSIVLGGK